MSTQNNPPQSFEQILLNMRNELVLAQSRSNQLSLDSFDKLVGQIQQFSNVLQTKEQEIKRLGELCKKNNIDNTIKKDEKIPTVIPAKK